MRRAVPLFLVTQLAVVTHARAECERMLGLRDAPIADLLLARPTLTEVRYARTSGGVEATDLPSCTVGADLTIDVPSAAELDWLDIVLTRQVGGQSHLASDACALIADGRAQLRVRLIPGQRYLATVAAYDVEGRKSEPVNLDLVGPGLGTREWMDMASQCPSPPHARLAASKPPRKTWPTAIAAGASGLSLAWVLYLLMWPKRRRL